MDTILYILERDVHDRANLYIRSYDGQQLIERFSIADRMNLEAGFKLLRTFSFGYTEIISATALALRMLNHDIER